MPFDYIITGKESEMIKQLLSCMHSDDVKCYEALSVFASEYE